MGGGGGGECREAGCRRDVGGNVGRRVRGGGGGESKLN